MTDKFKARVREEMALTGESYSAVVNRWRKEAIARKQADPQPPIGFLKVAVEPVNRVVILLPNQSVKKLPEEPPTDS